MKITGGGAGVDRRCARGYFDGGTGVSMVRGEFDLRYAEGVKEGGVGVSLSPGKIIFIRVAGRVLQDDWRCLE